MVVVLKLGGSVITHKAEPESVDRDGLAACTRAVAAFDGDLVLVHGGGSFGHHHADQHGVTVTDATAEPRAVFDIHDSMRTLNDQVVRALHDRGVPAVGIQPLSMAHRDANGGLSLPVDQLATVLALGFVPVLFGDVVAHERRGFTIVSGDELAVALATGLDAARVGLCTGVPGVLDDDGEVIDRIRSPSDAGTVGPSAAPDVTGGMAGKVRELLGLTQPAWVFGLDDLPGFLAGEDVGTRIGGPAPAGGADG